MADVELLPCSVEHELRADAAIIRSWIDVANGPINREALADRLDRYANAAAAQSAEIEALRAEALRELEEREQRDEALLRQALEVLSRAHQAAMVQTLKARIPECAEFGGIAQDLDFVVAALRERLGEGAEP